MFRNHAPAELAILAAALAVAVCWRLHSAFRATPANFPVPKSAPRPPIPEEALYRGYKKSKEARR